ncbi:MAG TPA: MFS transporter [Dehalococcoidales bacterium]|nr:MFS transporter [Dehalococcoidales bacterium]
MFNLSSSQKQVVSKNYKWIALSNTTLAGFMVSLDGSCVMIAIPAIFRGIGLNPFGAGSSNYLLWLLMGYALVLAVLVTSFGRIGDMFGRVRMYNIGFIVFSIGSILLSFTWSTGTAGAIELIAFRGLQAVGGACLFANTAAILTDAFPENQRGMALGINGVSFIAGSFIGIIIGGLLAEIGWRWVFRVSIPVAVAGTIWSYLQLRELGVHRKAKIDWLGNLTFAAGLTLVLIAAIYGINPSAHSMMSWTTPFVMGMMGGGLALLIAFVFIEQHVEEPMFHLNLFRIRAFAAGNVAGFMSALARGGFMLILTIWLQGIWLPLHGYNFEVTPLWAGICMIPSSIGILLLGPLSGRLSDRYGARYFSTIAMTLTAIGLALLLVIPVDFKYPFFAAIIFLDGVSMGMFMSPNVAAIMNSLPPQHRGAGSGMRATLQNVGNPVSMAIIFSLMVIGLNATMPTALYNGLLQNGIPSTVAHQLASVPPVSYLFAAFMGYNPLATVIPQSVLNSLSPQQAANLTSRAFFPGLIENAFHHGLIEVLIFSIVICLIGAAASWVRGGKYVYSEVSKS